MREALRAASLLLVAGIATACGGDDGSGAPEEASVEEFCKAFHDVDSDSKDAELADELKAVGSPEDIPDNARKGFEFLIDNAEDWDQNRRILNDAQAFRDRYGDEEFIQFKAFLDYFAETCLSDPIFPS